MVLFIVTLQPMIQPGLVWHNDLMVTPAKTTADSFCF
jgi:hypothetical protein